MDLRKEYSNLPLWKDRFIRFFWYSIAMIIRPFCKVENKRVFCWANRFNQYACNPRFLTEYIINNKDEDLEVYWAFEKGFDVSRLDPRIHVVRYRTIGYLIALYKSRFIVNNLRNDRYGTFFVKKSNQKYLMLWHGSTPLKKIEKDAEVALGAYAVKRSMDDSSMCDLMISNCRFFTNLIRSSFWYDGEILECGLPRNDIFFNKKLVKENCEKVKSLYDIDSDTFVLLYAPTFRPDNKIDYYKLNWPIVIDEFENRFNKKVKVLLRLHPNMINIPGIDSLLTDGRMINATKYPDIFDILCATDALITDYSGTMFNFSFFEKPTFLYAIDKDQYDRGFYYGLDELPFNLATDEETLLKNVRLFDNIKYLKRLRDFKEHKLQIHEDGNSSKRLYQWMISNK